jgi:hypothetical protein
MFGSNVLKGVLLLARGKASGIAEFGGSPDALLASLAPLIAFPLVLTVLAGLNGQPEAAFIAFLSQLSICLAVSVITQGFAAWAGREALWVRTATALNWSFWFVIPLMFLADTVRSFLVSAGVPQMVAFDLLIFALGIYLFWYNCFTVRAGLQVKAIAAVGIVIITNLVVALLTVGPALIDHLMAKS